MPLNLVSLISYEFDDLIDASIKELLHRRPITISVGLLLIKFHSLFQLDLAEIDNAGNVQII